MPSIKKIMISGSRALILGFTFKENCPDIRNTGVVSVINRLKYFGLNTTIYDPWASISDVKNEYNMDNVNGGREWISSTQRFFRGTMRQKMAIFKMINSIFWGI